MAYDEENFEEALGWFVLAAVLVLMLVLAFGVWLVLGPGRIERRDVRAENRSFRAWAYLHKAQMRDFVDNVRGERETSAAPSAPPPCIKDTARLEGVESWTCGESPHLSRNLVLSRVGVTPSRHARVELPTLGGTAVEGP